MNLINQFHGVAWREKSFGQRLKFGLPGGKFVPLGPRTIFLGRPKHRMHLPISRMNPSFGISFCSIACNSFTISHTVSSRPKWRDLFKIIAILNVVRNLSHNSK